MHVCVTVHVENDVCGGRDGFVCVHGLRDWGCGRDRRMRKRDAGQCEGEKGVWVLLCVE